MAVMCDTRSFRGLVKSFMTTVTRDTCLSLNANQLADCAVIAVELQSGRVDGAGRLIADAAHDIVGRIQQRQEALRCPCAVVQYGIVPLLAACSRGLPLYELLMTKGLSDEATQKRLLSDVREALKDVEVSVLRSGNAEDAFDGIYMINALLSHGWRVYRQLLLLVLRFVVLFEEKYNAFAVISHAGMHLFAKSIVCT